jgi:hypothetical protein
VQIIKKSFLENCRITFFFGFFAEVQLKYSTPLTDCTRICGTGTGTYAVLYKLFLQTWLILNNNYKYLHKTFLHAWLNFKNFDPQWMGSGTGSAGVVSTFYCFRRSWYFTASKRFYSYFCENKKRKISFQPYVEYWVRIIGSRIRNNIAIRLLFHVF